MKKITAAMDVYFDKMDQNWKSLPVQIQHKYIMYFFAGYLLLTAGILGRVWYDISYSESSMAVGHIENPVTGKNNSPEAVQDRLSKDIKNKTYERK